MMHLTTCSKCGNISVASAPGSDLCRQCAMVSPKMASMVLASEEAARKHGPERTWHERQHLPERSSRKD